MAVTEDRTGHLYKIKWTWTCDSNGSYSEASSYRYNGLVNELITVPGTSTDAPTTLYDVTVTDADSADVLAGSGADRSATLAEYKLAKDGLGFVKSSLLTLNVANAGDTKKGTVILFIYDLDKLP